MKPRPTSRIEEVFGVSRVLLPVIRGTRPEGSLASIDLAVAAGVRGVILIDEGMTADQVIALLPAIHARHPSLWVGLNLLGAAPLDVLRRGLAADGRLDGIWLDDAGWDGGTPSPAAAELASARAALGWRGLVLGGVTPRLEDPGHDELAASVQIDVVCTPGPGRVADPVERVRTIRRTVAARGDLAVVSGVRAENVTGFLPYVDAVIIASGIERELGVLDPTKLSRMLELVASYPRQPPGPPWPFRTFTEPTFEYGYHNGRQFQHPLIDVTSSGRDALAHAMALAFENDLRVPAIADAGRALIFFSRVPTPTELMDRPWHMQLPARPMSLYDAVDAAWSWLGRAEYGRDEHDGDSHRGWHLFNGTFGIVDQVWSAFLAIEPRLIYVPK